MTTNSGNSGSPANSVSSSGSDCTVETIDFAGAHGVRLRGDLYLPSTGTGPFPGIVMAHGFSATRRMGLEGFARCFAAAGMAVLSYDHRNLGDSDGEPRQLINPWAQARDYRYALTWLAGRQEVDPARLGIWGSSYSGGEVLVVAAIDERVKAVVANAPFAGLSRDPVPAAEADEKFAAMRRALEDETGRGPADAGDVIGPMAVVDESGGPAFLPQPESARWFLNVGGAPDSGWQNTFTLQSMGGDVAFDPSICVPRIAPAALLMVVASEDRLAATDVAITAYSRAGQPKRLELLEGDHFVDYDGPAFDKASAAMREFLLEHL
jgi:fermentation-respiration switch protein FrsA (DUF1100 family)